MSLGAQAKVLRALQAKVSDARQAEMIAEPEEVGESTVITLSSDQLSEHWEVTRNEETGVYIVSGEKIEKFARRTNFDQYEAVNRLRDIMRKLGIAHELIRQGAEGDSLVKIGNSTEFTLVEQ